MNDDEMVRLGVFALLGGFGGLVRLYAQRNEEISFSVVLGHICVGAIFALMLPALCSLAEVVSRVVRHKDIMVAGGTALLIGLFARNILAWMDMLFGHFTPSSTYLRKIFGFPKRKK